MVVDPLKNYPGYALRRASAASMERLSSRLATLELRPSEASVLLVIHANPHVKQSQIGHLLDIAGANMAPLVGRLDRSGLIERHPVDGRSHGLTLSAAGRSCAAKVERIFKDHEEQLLAKIPKSQRATFLSALQALWKAE